MLLSDDNDDDMIAMIMMMQNKGRILNIFPQIAFTFNKRATG